ncbi:SDR family oxidoreductase [Nocardioides sp. dk4132]|uniref:SDR family oxidoreductase n=1 Tax=unclassified Nocardioides TaxID=2615069 RepID=UPI0012960F44|nr:MULTISPECIES: SDR family oxidoreductase [unclassified Nocardioides]MQW75540.1 SDR family oxidoreductase [Nocardioides sp. dk4132]QGA08451.1 SDR family oxidoreductase [Nocardioides sp. dk884]
MSARHLVTGAGSGIGRLLAERLAARGDELVLVARSAARAEDLRAGVPGAEVLVADLADPSAVEGLAGALPDSLDSVVHAAGVVELGEVGELTAGAWQDTLTVNLVAPAVLTRIALPALRSARGTAVFVNSGSGLRANPHWAAYSASKHGLRALADALRAEEQDRGVRVSSIYPGRVATAMQEEVHRQEGRDYDPGAWIDPATVVDAILHVLDLPGDATLTDLTLRPR